MSADTIRRAAALVRERAQAATTGPWGAETEDSGLMILTRGTCMPVAFIGPPEDGTAQADASHIALWHPAAALAVADWLDQAASWADAAARHHNQDRLDTHALRVARALLGEGADRG